MKTELLKHSFITLILVALASSQVIATNGYFSHGYGNLNKGTDGTPKNRTVSLVPK